ncbi:MAG: hypothetical protein AAF554_16160 [Bacteroidota bacterium]
MKQLFGFAAVLVMALGMVSCEAESDVQDTEALFETLEVQGTGGNGEEVDERDAG